MLIILVIILNLIIQSTILPYFSIMGVVPNTSLVLLVLISLAKGKVYGSVSGLIIGMLQDIMFSVTLGINSLIYFLIGYFIGFIEDTFARDNIINPIIFTASSTMFYNIVYSIFLYFLSIKITFTEVISATFSVEIVYNCLISVIVYKLFRRFILEPKIRFSKR
ncbi:MAG: rod shape-determining protein MreD [Tissierellia bacterium]|nr:rod shape-determining protein MreD [Tissierellia bacterium]MDD4725194.1 rod shape-determining protein MreD [Tissierellia bacterium]